MAVSKTINGSTNNSAWTYKLEVTETATNIQNNTSTVQVKAYLGRASSQSYLGGGYSLSVTCDGQSQNQSGTITYPTYINGGAWLELKTFTFTVPHNSDGTKTASISSSLSSNDFTPSYASASGSITLTALHTPPSLADDLTFTELNTQLTGVNGNQFVPYLSNKKFTIPATAYDGATITKYELIIGSDTYSSTTNQITINFAQHNMNIKYFDLLSRNILDLTIRLTDNMGGISTIAYPYTYIIPYEKPNLIQTSSNVKRNGQVSGKAKLTINGTYANVTVGNKTNAVTSFQYKYWKTTASEPSQWYNIYYTNTDIKNGTINKTGWEVSKYINNTWTPIEDVDSNSAYYFKIKVQDTFGQTSTITLTCPIGEWLMAKFKDRVDFKAITIGGYNPFEYSENETICGVWTDGKPIYRKVITMTTSNTPGDNVIYHGISNLDTVIHCYGFTKETSNDNQHRFFPNFYPGDMDPMYSINVYWLNNTQLNVYAGSNRTNLNVWLILEYTKTTD